MENTEEEILEFGIKRENEERRDGGCAVVFDPKTQLYAVNKDNDDGFIGFFGGGINKDEKEIDGIIREVMEESGLHDFLYVEKIEKVLAHYYNRRKKRNRIAEATCLLIILNSKNLIEKKLEEHENFTLYWVTAEEILSGFKSINHNKDYDHWIYFLMKAVQRAKELGYDMTSVSENLN